MILSSLVLTPVLTVLALLLVPSHRSDWVRWISLAGSTVALFLSSWVFLGYDAATAGFQFEENYPWLPGAGIQVHIGVDGLSAPMVLLTGVVFFTGVLTMWALQNRVKEYFLAMTTLVSGVFMVFVALDLFVLFFGYEIAVIPMYILIAVWGSTRREYAAMKLTLFLLAGSSLLIPALLAIPALGQVASFDIVALQEASLTAGAAQWIFLALLLGFGVLAGMWPFHTWSPVGHVAAPTAVSMLHAGVLMKLGAYGIARVGIGLVGQGAQMWADFMAVLATIGIVYGAFVALRQTDLKYVIGYSSVSHMGIVLLGLATLTTEGITGAGFQMFSHGIMTALFFSVVGHIYDQTHTRDIRELGGLIAVVPRASSIFVLAALCGMGVPLLSSFWAELLVFVSAVRVYPVRGMMAIGGLLLTALYLLRVLHRTFFGTLPDRWRELKDMNAWQLLPRVILLGFLLTFGFVPRWILDLLSAGTRALMDRL